SFVAHRRCPLQRATRKGEWRTLLLINAPRPGNSSAHRGGGSPTGYRPRSGAGIHAGETVLSRGAVISVAGRLPRPVRWRRPRATGGALGDGGAAPPLAEWSPRHRARCRRPTTPAGAAATKPARAGASRPGRSRAAGRPPGPGPPLARPLPRWLQTASFPST